MQKFLRPVKFSTLRGLGSDTTIAGGRIGGGPPPYMSLQSVIDLRTPKELKKVASRRTTQTVAPGELWRFFADQLEGCSGDPGKIVHVVKCYMQAEDELDVRFLVKALFDLGSTFDLNSFWSTGDKQIVKNNKIFKMLIADLIDQLDRVPASDFPAIVYALACLEYRPYRLMRGIRSRLGSGTTVSEKFRFEVVANMAFSLAVLGGEEQLDLVRDIIRAVTGGHSSLLSSSVHEWSQLAFAALIAEEYSVLPNFLSNCTNLIRTQAHLDRSGWTQFFLYQCLYAADVERPVNVEAIRAAIPEWIQKRLDFRWVDGHILTTCQPGQGIDLLQMDVDKVLKRTNTIGLINCSVGRDQIDTENHCWFAGHKLNPKIALEYNSHLSCEVSGWLGLKIRLMQKMGYSVAVIHNAQWKQLSDIQKEDQILLLRTQLGYVEEVKTENNNKATEPTKKTIREGTVLWENQPDWQPHIREPELELTVHGYKPKGDPNFKGGVRVNFRRRHVANGNHNWVNSLAPKG